MRLARIYRRNPVIRVNDLSEINQIIQTETFTYEEAFNIVKNYVQIAAVKPYTDISIPYAYLDILGVIEKMEIKIRK